MLAESSPKSLVISDLILLSDNYEIMSDFVMTIKALLAYKNSGEIADFNLDELEKLFNLIDINFRELDNLISEQRKLSENTLAIVKSI